jgi:hypothetical protein
MAESSDQSGLKVYELDILTVFYSSFSVRRYPQLLDTLMLDRKFPQLRRTLAGDSS